MATTAPHRQSVNSAPGDMALQVICPLACLIESRWATLMQIPLIRQSSLVPVLAARDPRPSGHWRIALLASLALWGAIAALVGVAVTG
jgi:hypothetical protein